MLNEILLSINKKKLYSAFLDVMGFIKIKNNNVYSEKNRVYDYNKKINFLSKYEHKYKTTNKDIELEIIFNFVKLKLSILDNENIITELLLKKIKENISDMHGLDYLNKDLFSYLHSFFDISYKSLDLINSINYKNSILEEIIINNNNKINDLVASYKFVTLNSKEYLLSSSKHLELIVENAKIKTQEELIVDNDMVLKGENLLYSLNLLMDKLIKCDAIVKNNNNFIIKDITLAMLYSLVMAEKIKIKFYIGEKFDKLFNEVTDLVKLQISLKNKDPLSFAIYNTIGEDLYNISVYKNHDMFDRYIKSFVIEIYELKNNLINFKLKQFSNFTAKDKMERLKIIKSN